MTTDIKVSYCMVPKDMPQDKGGLHPSFWKNHPDWNWYARTNVPYSRNKRVWLGGGGITREEAIASAKESVELDNCTVESTFVPNEVMILKDVKPIVTMHFGEFFSN